MNFTGRNHAHTRSESLTAVFMILNMELGKEPCRTNGDERRAVGAGPEESGELGKNVLVQVMGDDYGE